MSQVKIDIGKNLRDVLAEVGNVWKAAESGAEVQASDHICFVDWSALCAVMTPKRYALISHLRRNPAPSIRALARSLERDVKRVHEDVVALSELGLIKRDAATGALSTDINEITSTIKFAA